MNVEHKDNVFALDFEIETTARSKRIMTSTPSQAAVLYLRDLSAKRNAGKTLLEKTRYAMTSTKPRDLLTAFIERRIKDRLKQKPNEIRACIILLAGENWQALLPYKLDSAIQSLQATFRINDNEASPLTNAAINIGRSVLSEPEDRTTEELLIVGDLFVEALFNLDFVALKFFKPLKEGDRGMHVISPGIDWMELAPLEENIKIGLTGTVLEKPKDTSHNVRKWVDGAEYPNEITRRIVKRSKKHLELDLQAPWVKALDKQQQTGLRVNKPVLEAIETNPKLFFYSEPKNVHERASWRSKKLAHVYALSKAKQLSEANRFYCMLDTDYRGRYYNIESFFSYQGHDTARGLIIFDEGVEMTAKGRRWLAIHVATTFNPSFDETSVFDFLDDKQKYHDHMASTGLDTISLDKLSLNDRAEWTYYNSKQIVEWAKNNEFPVDGDLKFIADDPVQFMAAAKEWAALISAEEKGEVFITHLPIPIDGSNNGWQHLAAISRDKQAGELVGLTDIEIPKDFYIATAQRMMADMDDEELQAILDQMNMGQIRKGISKRGSMTKAYSAGAGAIAENMWADIKKAGFDRKFFGFDDRADYYLKSGEAKQSLIDLRKEIGNTDAATSTDIENHARFMATEYCQELCKKFAKRLDKAIKEVCPGPLETMKWFQKLVGFALGTFQWEDDDGHCVNDFRKDLMERKQYINGKREDPKDKRSKLVPPTDNELVELNTIAELLDGFKRVLVAGEGQKRIQWKTPSGFHVSYENMLVNSTGVWGPIKGYGNSDGVFHVIKQKTDIPDTRSFASGIAPNIVHSLDASHLAITCYQFEHQFLGIHDSYSTHASHVDELLDTAKVVFVDTYNHNIEGEESFFDKMKSNMLTDPDGFEVEPPEYGELDLTAVVGSDNFFS